MNDSVASGSLPISNSKIISKHSEPNKTNETSNYSNDRSQHGSNYVSDWLNDSVGSGCSPTSNSKIISKHSEPNKTNETSNYSNYRSRHGPNHDFEWMNDSVASGSLPISNSKIPSKTNRIKCGGRGMAIQELALSMGITCSIRKSNLSFSNSKIESHFKNLKENLQKQKEEENEKKWENYFHSYKST
ncbi:uncharacterized protein LOC132928051 [Rhopalosiphum padi]|uniref:uncharacterized protein LOC132928051 n=1 Tax=Rhopalosiphum padi TaxID=40932 RepID=UPI00298E6231|nr:uncharacterized protein LOC132928051 [Rhopalosiphum padi]